MKTIDPSLLKTPMLLILAAVLLVSGATAQAQNVATWNFTNTLAASTVADVTAANASLGSAIPINSFNGGTEFYGENGWPSGALDPNAYLQFSVSPTTGHYLALTSVSITIRRSNTGSPAGSGPNNWSLRSSVDGYTTDLATNSMTYNYATFSVSLPAPFQTQGSTVTFRLYGYNMTINSGGNSRFVYDAISIQGQSVSGVLAEQSIDLTAKASSNGIKLQWQEQGLDAGTQFSAERSVDGVNFATIDQQTGTATTYQYIDLTAPSTRLFYRITATQPDGTTLRSATAVVTNGSITTGTSIRSVAAQGSSVRTSIHLASSGAYQLNIWSSDGKPLHSQTINEPAGDQIADISLGNYPHGVYILTLSKDGVNTSRSFLF